MALINEIRLFPPCVCLCDDNRSFVERDVETEVPGESWSTSSRRREMNVRTAPLGKVFNLYLINQQQINANSRLFGKQGEIIFQQSLFFSQTRELSRRWVTAAGLWHDNNIYSLCLKWVWVSGEKDFITYGCVRDGTRWHKVKLSYFHSSNPLFGCSASMLSHLQTLPLDDSISFSPGVWVCHSANPQSNHNLFFPSIQCPHWHIGQWFISDIQFCYVPNVLFAASAAIRSAIDQH